MYSLNTKHQDILNKELKPLEKVQWTGQPDPKGFMKESWISVLFFIPWTAFSIFWIAGASGFSIPNFSQGGFTLFPLFGLPFLFIGLWGLSAPLRVKSKAKNMIYAVTTERILIIEAQKNIRFKSYYPKDLGIIEKIQKSNNKGNIYFSSESYKDSDGDTRSKNMGFIAIENIDFVENRIIEMINGTFI